MRVGFFGGAFNPPHVGHLVCAQEALRRLGLDLVLWVPVGEAPHREVPQDPGTEARVELCEAAVRGDGRFEVSRMEVEREGPSYTADSLAALRERSPQDELFLILGGDQAAALPSWHRPADVARLATIAVAERAGGERAEVEAALAGLDVDVEFFEMPRIDVSSTAIRERAGAGEPIRYLVPDAVAAVIAERSLYGASVAS